VKSFYCAFLLLSLTACSSDSGVNEITNESSSFIKLKELVNDDINQLEFKKCGAVKRGIINGDTASSEVPMVQWKKELQAIADADINKRAWIPFFKSDSLYLNGDTLQIVIQSVKEDIPVRLINVWVLNGEIIEVYIEKKNSNLFFSAEQKITYQPGSSYHINGTQKALFLPRKEFEITSVFNCKE
jgi:hypothetical protein